MPIIFKDSGSSFIADNLISLNSSVYSSVKQTDAINKGKTLEVILWFVNEKDSFIYLIAAEWPDLAFLYVILLVQNRSQLHMFCSFPVTTAGLSIAASVDHAKRVGYINCTKKIFFFNYESLSPALKLDLSPLRTSVQLGVGPRPQERKQAAPFVSGRGVWSAFSTSVLLICW